MLSRFLRVALLAASLSAGAAPIAAHHAFSSEYDANRPVTLTGTIALMEWVNPHAWIHIEVTRPDGTVERWAIESATPNTLLRRGLRKMDLLPGAVLTVDGYQAQDRRLRVHGRNITLTDGRRVFISSPILLGDDQR